MKKKFLAGLAAAVLLCGALTAPASAESKYRKGDVNRDGEVSVDDAQLALKEYLHYVLAEIDHFLDEEQMELADVAEITGKLQNHPEIEATVTLDDVFLIFKYYTACVAEPALKETDVIEWGKVNLPALFEKE